MKIQKMNRDADFLIKRAEGDEMSAAGGGAGVDGGFLECEVGVEDREGFAGRLRGSRRDAKGRE